MASGSKYVGGVDDKMLPSGPGRIYGRNGRLLLDAEFSRGKANSFGRAFYPNGLLAYQGEFKRGKMHGRGTLFFKVGRNERNSVFNFLQKENRRMFMGNMLNGEPSNGTFFTERGEILGEIVNGREVE